MSEHRSGLGDLQVLVVEDHADSREVVATQLRALGVSTHTAPDGATALPLIEAHPPDLILTDLDMPRLDGFGLMRWIRSQPHLEKVLVVALTGLGGPVATRATAAAGFDAHIVKPMTQEALMKLLAQVLALQHGYLESL